MLRPFLYLLFSLGVATAHAYTGFGVCNYGKETVSTVTCYEPAVLKDTKVEGEVKVVGSFRAVNVTMGTVMLTGEANIQDSIISGQAYLIGKLLATNVTFKKSLTITAEDITLNHTTINGELTITSEINKPTLKMECNSTVSGTVTFLGKEGVVQITDDSMVQGKILNGTLEFVKKRC